jgi:hypothetical protein
MKRINSVITGYFEINKNDKIVIPRTKAGQKLILEKLHIDRVNDQGIIVNPDNLKIKLEISSWPVLDNYSGTLLANNPNTTKLNHEFDANDDIVIDIREIIPTSTTDKVLVTIVVGYENDKN